MVEGLAAMAPGPVLAAVLIGEVTRAAAPYDWETCRAAWIAPGDWREGAAGTKGRRRSCR